MVHYQERVEHAWLDGIILVCKLSSGREASATVRFQDSQATGAGRIYDTSSGLKGQDSFPTSAVFDSSVHSQYTCSSRPPSMIQGTGFVTGVRLWKKPDIPEEKKTQQNKTKTALTP